MRRRLRDARRRGTGPSDLPQTLAGVEDARLWLEDDERKHPEWSVPLGVRTASEWAWRTIVIAVAVVGLLYLASVLSSVVIPLLVALLQQPGMDSVLVFSRTRHGADRVVRSLHSAGIEATALHADKSQSQRSAALDAFKRGTIRVLVATDIAQRGLDIIAEAYGPDDLRTAQAWNILGAVAMQTGDLDTAEIALQRAHTGDELLDVEGLGKVVVGSGVEACDALRDRVACAEDEDRDAVAGGARAAQHVDAVYPRESQVEHDCVEAAVLEGRRRERPGAHPLDREARARQRVLNACAEKLVVLH